MLTTVLVAGLWALAWLFRRTARLARDTARELERARSALAVTQKALQQQGRTLLRVMEERDALAAGDAGAAVLRDAVDRCAVYTPEAARFQAVAQTLMMGRGWFVRVGSA